MPKCLYCGKKTKGRRIYCNTQHRVYYHRSISNTEVTRNSDKTILSLCDYSGKWSKPYKEAGYNIIQIDIELNGQDIRLLTRSNDNVYGILAAPPCTEFASSGAAWWNKKGDEALLNGLSIVDACLRAIVVYQPRFWALENPVGRLKNYLGEPRWRFHPYDYGTPYTKKTCLWGNFNIPKPNPIEVPKTSTGHHAIDQYWKNKGKKLGKNRARLRSMTPENFAQAFFEVNR